MGAFSMIPGAEEQPPQMSMAPGMDPALAPPQQSMGQQGGPPLSQPPEKVDPLAAAARNLDAISQEMGPLDTLRRFGASMIPSVEDIVAQRQRRRMAMEQLQATYRNQPDVVDPVSRMLAGIMSTPRREGIGPAIGAGLTQATEGREFNRKMRSAREAAAAQAGSQFENQEYTDLVNQGVVGANMMLMGQRAPKQFSTIVNDVLERRNQIFDKLQKLGVDASSPEGLAAIEAKIDKEVAPLVKALWAEYPQYRDLLTQTMPQIFSTFNTQGQPRVVTPAAKPAGTVTPAANPATEPPRLPGVQPEGDFADFITPAPGLKQAQGMRFKDKAAEEAQKANAAAATKYYAETVVPGADSGNAIANAVSQLKAIGPNTGMLTPYKAVLGRALESVGINSSLVDDAIKTGNAEMILQAMANAILMAAKGVQTEGDARRAFQQAAMITDPVESWKYKLRAMEAAAERLRYRQKMFRDYAQSRNGNFDGAESAFTDFEASVPFVRELPTRDGKSKAVFFNEFINARVNQGKTRREALKEWKDMTP